MSSKNKLALERLQKVVTTQPQILFNDGYIHDNILFSIMTEKIGHVKLFNKKLNATGFYNDLINMKDLYDVSIIYRGEYIDEKKIPFELMNDDAFDLFLINGEMLVKKGIDDTKLLYLPEVEIEPIVKLIKKNFQKKTIQRNKFFMIVNSEYGSGFDLKSFDIKKTETNLELNYNDDFIPVHETIVKFLKNKKKNGLVLLHGKPGTGKTTYLRHIIKSMNQKIIYLPMHLMSHISEPAFVNFISDNQNSVLILEDCEEILKPRQNNKENNPAITNLLNLGDGLLSDALNIKVICTFNAEYQNIDNAILRKGRLIARYEFKELEKQKAQALLNHLKKDYVATTNMTLADIYNIETENYGNIKQTKKIGFKNLLN